MFIQRQKELELLNSSYELPYATLELVFGASNTGKTALLKEYTNNKNKLYIANYEMIKTHFFTSIANIINQYFEQKEVKTTFNSFKEVLEFLSKHTIKEKLVVMFDDFQNISKIDKEALNSLLFIWKKSLSKKNIQIILCSSSYIDDKSLLSLEKIVNNKIEIDYLKFDAIKSFFPKINKLDQLYVYSLLGTSPTNLKYYNTTKSFSENIFNLFLSPNAYLFDYGRKVLKSQITDIGTYSSILYAVSLGKSKIGDIAEFLDVKSTYLTRYMQKLQDMMILKKIVPIGESYKSTKYSRYEIIDNTIRFWFSYIFPNLEKLQFLKIEDVGKLIESEFIARNVLYCYKKYIKEYIKSNQKNTFGYEPTNIGSWWDNNDQIDLIAYDDKNITFVQILWEDSSVAKHSYEKLVSISKKYRSSLKRNYLIITKNSFLNI